MTNNFKMIASERFINLEKIIKEYGPEKAKAWVESLTEEELQLLTTDPFFNLRLKQIIPSEDNTGHWGTMLIPGRALAPDTDILTDQGFIKFKDIKVGDVVFDESGQPCNVTAVHHQDTVKAYRFTFSDGATLDACDQHKWLTWTHRDRKQFTRHKDRNGVWPPEDWVNWKQELWTNKHKNKSRGTCGPSVKTSQEIVDTFTTGKREDKNHCIPLAGELNLGTKNLPICPKLLGLWLGDGGTGSATIACHEDDASHYEKVIKEAGYEIGVSRKDKKDLEAKGWRISVLGLNSKINKLCPSKTIPKNYLLGDRHQRLDLLRGLMDSDGYCCKDGYVEFCAKRKEHSEAVVFILHSLGENPTISEYEARLYGKDYGSRFRVHWTPMKINPFSLPRKAELVKLPDGSKRQRASHRMFTKFEDLGEQEGYLCITVDSPNNLFLAGKELIPTHNSFGKSFSCSAWVIQRAVLGKGPIAIVGETASAVRDVMVEIGDSSIMRLCPDRFMPEYVPSKRRLTFPNGVICMTYAGFDPDSLRGPQHQSAVVDELAKYDYAEDVMSNLSMGLRLGTPYTVVATTPRPTEIIRKMYEDPSWHVVKGSTFENTSIPESFKEQMRKDYEGTTLGRQELLGEILWESDNALWRREIIDPYRVTKVPTEYHNIVIAVDPSVGQGLKKNDATGIIVACSVLVDGESHAYILEDATMKGTPIQWAKAVKDMLDKYPEANILAESNAGGTLITEVLTKYGIPAFKIQLKHHMKSKYDRAQPVALFAEKGMIHHCGVFPELEDELCSYDGDSKQKSPNRLDALVIACHALLVKIKGKWGIKSMGI